MLLANGGFLLVLLAVGSLQLAYTKRDSSHKAAIDIDTQSMLIEADGQVRQSFTSLEDFVLYVLQNKESEDNVTTCHMSMTPQEPAEESGAKQGEEASKSEEMEDNLSVGEKVLRKNAEAFVLQIHRTMVEPFYTVCMLEDGREVNTERKFLKKLSKDSKAAANRWQAAGQKVKAAEQCRAARKQAEERALEEEAKCIAKGTCPDFLDGEWDKCLLNRGPSSFKCQCVHARCETKTWTDAELADENVELLSRKEFMEELEEAIWQTHH